VKLLANQGLSTRQIAKIVGADPMTVWRDQHPVANATETVANATPELDSIKEEHKKEIDELNDKIEKAKTKKKKDDEEHAKEVERLQERISNLQEGPPPTDFEKQIDRVTGPLVSFIQHDDLVKMLSDLEIIKEDTLGEFDMPQLERVIHALVSLSQRAKSWSERLTPTNSQWKHRIHHLHEGGTKL